MGSSMTRFENLTACGSAALAGLFLCAAVVDEPAVDPEAGAVAADASTPMEPPRASDAEENPELTEASLAPVFAEEPMRSARDKLDQGRFAEALALLPEEGIDGLEGRFLRAMALSKAGRSQEAAEAFARLATSWPALSDRCHFYSGVAWEEAGNQELAVAAFEAIDEGSIFYLDARRNLAQLLKRRADRPRIIEALRPVTALAGSRDETDSTGDALFELAELLEAEGDHQAAAEAFLKDWVDHPASRTSVSALERARRLGGEPSAEQRILRGEALLETHQSRQAMEILRPIVESPPKGLSTDWVCRARFALGKSFRKMRAQGKALATLQVVIEQCEPGSDPWARSLYLAGSLTSSRDAQKAVRYFQLLAQEAPEHTLADDALFLEADLLSRQGRSEQARIALQRLVKLYPDGDFRAEALFRLFWVDRASGRLDRGLKILGQLEREAAGGLGDESEERAAYWIGRTLVDLGRPADGAAKYEALLQDHPASYYSTLARSRLIEIAPERVPALAAETEFLPVAPSAGLKIPLSAIGNDRHLVSALALTRMGFSEMATEELLFVDRTPLKSAEPPWGLRLLVMLLARNGEIRIAHIIARTELQRDLTGSLNPGNLEVWHIAYPLAYRATIDRRGQEAGLDPDLLQALIREESALNPKARSWAGAVGLCQVMMPTAREVARWLRIKERLTAERLHDPDLNVQLGATYLARLMRRFNGNLALALAAYNAGGGAVGGWLKASERSDLDEFIEEIPVSETRHYVKRVLRSYAAYQLLYGRSAKAAFLEKSILATR
jgi:soluble lytic murein transglycosylase